MHVTQPTVTVNRNRRTGLIAGVAVLALLVVVVWVAVLVRVLGSDDDGDPAAGEDNVYVVVDRLCESLDLTTVFETLPATGDGLRENVVESEVGTLRDCFHGVGQGDSVGNLWIKVSIYDSPEIAGRTYEGNLSGGTISVNSETIEDVDGPWQEGVLGLGAGGEGYTAGAEVCVRDHNLNACVAMRMIAAPDLANPPTDQDLAAALQPVVEDILARSRR
jgi:hypothetical protein